MSKGKILIVEDQRLLWIPIQSALEAREYEVHWATSATEALLVLHKYKFKFDVMILDLMVPLRNVGENTLFPKGGDSRRGGLILYEAIKAEAKEGIPTIIITVVTDPEIRRAANGFAHQIFTKPFSLKELLEAIERVSQSNKIYHQLKEKNGKAAKQKASKKSSRGGKAR